MIVVGKQNALCHRGCRALRPGRYVRWLRHRAVDERRSVPDIARDVLKAYRDGGRCLGTRSWGNMHPCEYAFALRVQRP